MANHVTQAERSALVAAAKQAITLDETGEIVGGFEPAWRAFAAQHGISDGSAYASFTNDDLDRLAEHLAPPRLMAAADGLEWRDLGYHGKE